MIDKNHDERLSRIEVIKAIRSNGSVRSLLGLTEIHQEDGSRDRFEEIFQAIDKNMSKSIDQEEFVRYFQSLGSKEFANKAAAFLKERTISLKISEQKTKRKSPSLQDKYVSAEISNESETNPKSKFIRVMDKNESSNDTEKDMSELHFHEDASFENTNVDDSSNGINVTHTMATWLVEQLDNGVEISGRIHS